MDEKTALAVIFTFVTVRHVQSSRTTMAWLQITRRADHVPNLMQKLSHIVFSIKPNKFVVPYVNDIQVNWLDHGAEPAIKDEGDCW